MPLIIWVIPKILYCCGFCYLQFAPYRFKVRVNIIYQQCIFFCHFFEFFPPRQAFSPSQAELLFTPPKPPQQRFYSQVDWPVSARRAAGKGVNEFFEHGGGLCGRFRKRHPVCRRYPQFLHTAISFVKRKANRVYRNTFPNQTGNANAPFAANDNGRFKIGTLIFYINPFHVFLDLPRHHRRRGWLGDQKGRSSS